ncbi:uncharacterized protein LOC132944560 [Metopolophium dirhodum]|uniref:uncharacterized protein LOC132944560 n=1 Tax=Metopolophium dirhodum TaxID=44670 RepID=UPI00298FF740|nr:uncharacterized protein LOC132944560 [Metopolophium dirhodum]XP_060869974.1 uncharacterized protein LOC132944560 [Metopolophium dirhodum]
MLKKKCNSTTIIYLTMAMTVAYSWIIYSCLIFGSRILCDRKLERRQAVSSSSEDIDDMFYCSNGLRIEWSSVCDGRTHCSDGLDESNDLCARHGYGTNIGMDCGTVTNESKKEHLLEATPWIVDIYATRKKTDICSHLSLGSIISPNLVVAAAQIFWNYGINRKQISISKFGQHSYKIGIPLQTDNENNHYYIEAKMIYLFDEAYVMDTNTRPAAESLAVIVLANKISFSNGVTPVCIDWYSSYNVQNGAYGKIAGLKRESHLEHIVLQRFFPHIINSACLNIFGEHLVNTCIRFKLGLRESTDFYFQSLSFLHSNSYFLSGISSDWNIIDTDRNLPFLDIKYYVPWIRGILNKHSTSNVCVLPTVEGVVHSYKGSHSILSPGTLVKPNTTVIGNCEVGYHKAHTNGFRVCRRYGIWKTDSDKLCLKMCPPLLSDSLDIKCSYNSKYANCSTLSIPHTIASQKCKPTYDLPNGLKESPLEILCLTNGLWTNELHKCNPLSSCILPTVEGVVYTYENSNESLSHGTLINHDVTVNENCKFGYHKVYLNSIRVCQKNGKWKTDYNKLCLKMCPPLLSDSLDIKCSYNGKYANCSNLSIPDTIAKPSCKPTHYFAPNGPDEAAQELHCQSNGLWDKELYRCNIILNTCVLPKVEGVVYTYEYSNESLSHGTLINHGVTVNENCTFGYHNVYPNSFRVCQINGKWKTAYDKLCLKMCPPLLSDSLDIKCTYNGKKTNCSNLSIPDTIAIPKCKDTYSLPNGKIETPIELHCQSNGLWDKELYICEPDCGRPFIKTQILINNGETANVGTAPWNVAIYKKKSNYEFECGGSIISRNLVVSAAHCFWKKGMPYTIIIIDDLYKVAAGKYYKNFKIFDNEYPQIINVDRILMQDGYYGFFGHYAVDIAVVVLHNSVFFSNGITPVCMDWNGIYNVSNGDEGKIVGWGKTKEGIESPILLKTGLPYINMTTCRDMYTLGFESYVTPDKCCAGFPLVPGYGVDEGDSGAGLCFSHSKLYYLTGVVSLREADANNSIALFTSVHYHIEWIRRLYTTYNRV